MSKKENQKLTMKQKCALEATKFVKENMVLGVGSGSTVKEFIKLLGHSKLDIKTLICIPSSYDTEQMLIENGFRIGLLNQYPIIDLTVDGADRVDDRLNLIKGGGGAMLQEKIIAAAAKKVIIIVDQSKLVQKLAGSFPVPIEVIPHARIFVKNELEKLGGKSIERKASDKLGPTITDNGNIILDVDFQQSYDPEELEFKLNVIPGIVENGIFSRKLINQVIVAEEEKIKILVKSD
ncbi:MAG: ribose-5-phosphate isomerase RpiA [Candidatus Thorarchaeota archaeon]